MPIYEYRCKSCGHELEKLRRLSDPPLTDCPACNQSELTRLVSAVGFRLKGSGWYETDFKQGNKKNLHDSGDSGDGASKPDSSASGDSDSKATKKSSDSKSSSEGSGKESGRAEKKKSDAS